MRRYSPRFVAGIGWNHWPGSRGICGRDRLESVAGIVWNLQGNLGEEQKSQNLYNLARIKGRIGKFNEAEDLHKQSIEIEKKLSPQMTQKLGKRYVELAVIYLMKTKMANGEIKLEGVDLSQGEDKIKDGSVFLQELTPIVNQYSGSERASVKKIYQAYSEELMKQNQVERANEFSIISGKL